MTDRVDAHCHLWRLDRGDYDWLMDGGDALTVLRRDFSTDDLRAAADIADVRSVVAVQAAPTLAETRYLLDLAQATPMIDGVVGWVDLSDANSVDDLESLAESAEFLGVRPMLQDLDDPDWITARPAPACLSALSRLKLRFDALVTPVQLPALLRFIDQQSALPVMIDHAAKPALDAPANDPRQTVWRSSMKAMASAPQVCCKLSGLLTELPAEKRRTVRDAIEALRPLVDDLLSWFGPDRLAWGSDWPVLTLAGSMQMWRDVTDGLLAPLDAAARGAILGGTAKRFYDLTSGVTA